MDIYIQIIRSISHKNKYLDWYIDLCLRAKERALTKNEAKAKIGYCEKHHIVPKSFNLGGEKDPKNFVFLTGREHLVIHLLLPKFLMKKNHIQKAKEAITYFNNNKNRKISFNTRELAWIRESNSIASSTRNKGNQYYKFRDETNAECKKLQKENASNSKWVTNGITEHFVRNYDEYIQQGYIFGRKKKPVSEKRIQRLRTIEEQRIRRKLEKELKILQKEKERQEKMLLGVKRKPMSDIARKNISEGAKNRKRTKHSEETKQKISLGNRGKKRSKETKEKLSKIAKNRPPVRLGAKLSSETKQKISESNKGRTAHNKGKPMSENQKLQISKRMKEEPKILCENCGQEFDRLNYKKWHGDKCKKKSRP